MPASRQALPFVSGAAPGRPVQYSPQHKGFHTPWISGKGRVRHSSRYDLPGPLPERLLPDARRKQVLRQTRFLPEPLQPPAQPFGPQGRRAAAKICGPCKGGVFPRIQLGVEPDEVAIDSTFIDDLGADSLDIVELIMAFEEEFNIEIPDEAAEKIKTVQDVVTYIDQNSK